MEKRVQIRTSFVRISVMAASLVSLAFPFAASAAGTPQTLTDFVGIFIDLIQTAIPIIAAAGLLVFIWGLVKFISVAGDAKSHESGRSLMIWGGIGLFVMVTIWGILSFLVVQFGFGNSAGIPILPENGTINTNN